MGSDCFLRSGHSADWWRVLAAAVIRQALLDTRQGRWARNQDVADAVEFLQGEDGRLAFWCEVSGLPLEGVRKLAQQALGEGWRPQGLGRLAQASQGV